MIMGTILGAVVTTAFSAFTEGVCVGVATYSIAKSVGKANFSFKK